MLPRCGRMVAFVLLTAAGECCAQPKEPCLAFLLKADVTVLCENGVTQITHRRDIEDFAISEERSSLAFVTGRVLSRNAASTTFAYTAIVVNLKAGTSRKIEGIDRLVSTCGGILPNQIGTGTGTLDVITGEQVTRSPYVLFRCSADRKVVAGITKDGPAKDQRSDLYEGVLPSTRVAAAEDVDVYYFNVSPDGSKVAYFNDVRPPCLFSRPGSTQCVEHGTLTDPVSSQPGPDAVAFTGPPTISRQRRMEPAATTSALGSATGSRA